MVTAEEMQDWAQSNRTAVFVEYLKNQLQTAKDDWAREQFVGSSMEETCAMDAKALGGVSVLQQTIDLIDEMKEGTWHPQ